MSDAKLYTLCLLDSTAGVDLNGVAATETALYTNPTGSGRVAVITHIIIRNPSADATNADGTFGIIGGSCDEFGATQLWNIGTALDFSADGEYTVICMEPAAGVLKAGRLVDAGEQFGYEVTTAAGVVCTATMDIFGYEY